MMRSPGGFIPAQKCIILVNDVGDEGGGPCVGAGGTWGISIPSLNFSVNLKLLEKLNS